MKNYKYTEKMIFTFLKNINLYDHPIDQTIIEKITEDKDFMIKCIKAFPKIAEHIPQKFLEDLEVIKVLPTHRYFNYEIFSKLKLKNKKIAEAVLAKPNIELNYLKNYPKLLTEENIISTASKSCNNHIFVLMRRSYYSARGFIHHKLDSNFKLRELPIEIRYELDNFKVNKKISLEKFKKYFDLGLSVQSLSDDFFMKLLKALSQANPSNNIILYRLGLINKNDFFENLGTLLLNFRPYEFFCNSNNLATAVFRWHFNQDLNLFLNNLFDKFLTKTKSLHKIEQVLSDLTHTAQQAFYRWEEPQLHNYIDDYDQSDLYEIYSPLKSDIFDDLRKKIYKHLKLNKKKYSFLLKIDLKYGSSYSKFYCKEFKCIDYLQHISGLHETNNKEEFFSYFKKNIKKLSFSDADIANIFLRHLLGSYSQLLKITYWKSDRILDFSVGQDFKNSKYFLYYVSKLFNTYQNKKTLKDFLYNSRLSESQIKVIEDQLLSKLDKKLFNQKMIEYYLIQYPCRINSSDWTTIEDINFYRELSRCLGRHIYQYGYVPDKFIHDKEIWQNAVLKSYKALRLAPKSIKEDKFIVSLAYSRNPKSFSSASIKLKHDFKFLKELFKNVEDAFIYVPQNMKIKEDICVPALKKSPSLISYISQKKISKVPFKKFSKQTRLDLYNIYKQTIGHKDILELANLKRIILGDSCAEEELKEIKSEPGIAEGEVEFTDDILDESKNPFAPSNLPF